MSSDYISPDAIPKWVSVCSQIAPISSILLFLSPIPTIRNIIRNGMVGDLPLLPYTTMSISCFVWILYGIQTGEPTLWCTNLIECSLAVYYVVEFTNHAPLESPTFPGSVQRHFQVCGGLAVGCVGVALTVPHETAVRWVGLVTVVLTSATFASPLVAIQAVWDTGSSDAIPWPFTLAAALNCMLWTVVGIWDMQDFAVYFPSLLGLLFALLQVACKLYFRESAAGRPSRIGRVAAPPAELPYPILGRIRQLIMWGEQVDTGLDDSELGNRLLDDESPAESRGETPPPLPPPSRLASVRSRSGSLWSRCTHLYQS